MRLILDRQGWKGLPELWSGGQGWTKILKKEFNVVWSARVISAFLHCHHSSHWNGLLDPGTPLTCWFCWSIHGMYVSHHSWCSLKRAGVHPVISINATVIIQHMRTIFSLFRLAEILVTDNSPSFVNLEFLHRNGIQHKTTDPYHQASNGLAEWAVQIFKKGIRKMQTGTLQDKITLFPFSCWNTPQSTELNYTMIANWDHL